LSISLLVKIIQQ